MNFNKIDIKESNPLINELNTLIQKKYINFATQHIVNLCDTYNDVYKPMFDKIAYGPSRFVIPLTFRYVNGELFKKYPLHFVSKYENEFAFFTYSPQGKRYQYALTPYEGDTVGNKQLTYWDVDQATKFAAQMECFKQSFVIHDVDQLEEVLPYFYKYCIKKVLVEIPRPENIEMFKILEYDIQD